MALEGEIQSGPTVAAIATDDGFKDALARLASGVAIIACWDGETPKGALVSSLIGLSVSPRRMLFSIRHDASAYRGLIGGGRCTATLLGQADRQDAELFSSSAAAAARFASRKWRLDDAFAPRFSGGVSAFDLTVEKRIGAESHTIIIATVGAFDIRGGAPLVYFNRGLHGLAGEAIAAE